VDIVVGRGTLTFVRDLHRHCEPKAKQPRPRVAEAGLLRSARNDGSPTPTTDRTCPRCVHPAGGRCHLRVVETAGAGYSSAERGGACAAIEARTMQDSSPGRPALDADTIAFAGRVFQMARGGQAPELAALLAAGLPANLINDKGDSLLMLASYHGHLDTVRALMAHGGDPTIANDRGQVPLAAAAFKGYADIIEAMLEGGAALDGCGPDGKTALMMAAMFDRIELVDVLLARGADPSARDAAGLTARELADRMGATEAAARLAERAGS